MTVASTVRRNVYNYTAGQTVFPFTFPVLEKSHVEVYVLPTGQTSPTLLVNGVDYSVFGEGLDAGGNVTLAAPTVGTGTLTIIRVVPLTQPTDFKNQGSFFPRTHERAFDRVTMLAQQIAETLSRSLTLPIDSAGVSPELPPPSVGSVFGWNDTLTGIRNVTIADAGTGIYAPGFAGALPSRLVAEKLREVVSLKDFGAVGDGVTDDTAAIQAAINSGATVITVTDFARYRITDTLVFSGPAVTFDLNYCEIELDDPTGLKSHIFLGGQPTQKGGYRILNTIFTRKQVATAGYAIDSDFIGVCVISGCRVFGNNEIFGGIRIRRGIIIEIARNYIDNCIGPAIDLIGTDSSANRTVDVSIRENRVDGCLNALRTGDFTEGLFCRDNIFYAATGYAVVLDATTNANGLWSFKLQENDYDTCAGGGVFIRNVSNVQVTDGWFSGNGGDDLVLEQGSDGVVVVGNQIYPSATGIVCRGNAARINSNLFSGGIGGILVDSTATRTDIAGNTISNTATAITLDGAATNTHVVGNSIYAVSVSVISGVGGTGTVIQNNKGDNTVGNIGFVSVGPSPFTYTCGPRPVFVSVFSGVVSSITVNGTNVGFSTDRTVVLTPGQSMEITYTSSPFMTTYAL